MSNSEIRPKKSRAKAASSTAKPARVRETTATLSHGTETVTGRVSLTLSKFSGLAAAGFEVLGKAYRWSSETVTKVGLIALVFVLLWLPLGVILEWPEFAFLGAVSALVLAVAIPFLIGKNEYDITFELPDDHLVAGEQTSAPISITNTSNRLQLPGVLEVKIGDGVEEFPIPLLRAGETKFIDYEIPSQRRGVLKLGPITTVRTDPLAALRRENHLVEEREIFVHPQTRQLPRTREGILRDLEGDPTSSIVDSDMSFHSVREYVVGDNPKHIHWKLTAKLGQAGKFMLRQYEESRRSKMVVILAANTSEYRAGTDEFEIAVSAAGSLGISAIRDQRKISVLASEQIPAMAKGRMFAMKEFKVQTRRRLLDDLCLISASDLAMNLKDVCRLATSTHADVSLAVIVVGSTVTPRAMQEIKMFLPKEIGVLFVVADSSEKAEPKFSEINGMKIFTIQEIQDLPGLMGRFVR
jgi:uncharacterized protein (DUF58 family)